MYKERCQLSHAESGLQSKSIPNLKTLHSVTHNVNLTNMLYATHTNFACVHFSPLINFLKPPFLFDGLQHKSLQHSLKAMSKVACFIPQTCVRNCVTNTSFGSPHLTYIKPKEKLQGGFEKKLIIKKEFLAADEAR